MERRITKAQREMNDEVLDPDTMKLRHAASTVCTGVWLLIRTMYRVLADL